MHAAPPAFAARARVWGALLLCGCGGAWGTPVAGAAVDLSLPRGTAAEPSWQAQAAEALRPPERAEPLTMSIVALPPEGLPGTRGAQRVRHALSVRSETPQRMLRAVGVDATDCSARFRMPTRLNQGSGGVDVDVRAQIGLACRF